MSPEPGAHEPGHLDAVCLYALQALPPDEATAAEAQLAACPVCRRDLEALRPVMDSLVAWPTDVLRPSTPLWDRLAHRIAADTGKPPLPAAPPPRQPDWDEVAPGISVRILARDEERSRVSMLVRLTPGTDYPPHRHAGVEELHLLDGVLVVDDRTLYPGDYIHAVAGTEDHRVWSGTGCTCVLLTSTRDVLF